MDFLHTTVILLGQNKRIIKSVTPSPPRPPQPLHYDLISASMQLLVAAPPTLLLGEAFRGSDAGPGSPCQRTARGR